MAITLDNGNQRTLNLPNFDKPPGAIAIDLDGTLLDSQTRLSARNRRAVEYCLARGIPVIIATSRPARIFNRIFPQDLAKCSRGDTQPSEKDGDSMTSFVMESFASADRRGF